ncbi:ATP-binding protein [Rhodoferax sp.]|uniref:ATP-binding protein n=1 Tax=Rhodoferax sp. TaxID=50421 RepID=UPI00262E4C3F|nr:ATP-binding protein [Rhodoferax sp.]MDD2926646.1 ATP-binding protein [Rhodoferax sp.]
MILSKKISLSQRLLITLGLASLLYWAAIAVLTTRDNIDRVDELYDVHLARTAKAFLHLMDPDDDAIHALPSTLTSAEIEQLFSGGTDLPDRPENTVPAGNRPDTSSSSGAAKRMQYGNHLRYQLWRDDGRLLLRSANALSTVPTDELGFSDTTDPDGYLWHHYSFHDRNHGVRVIVSEPHDFRQDLIRNMVVGAATPLVLGLPVLFVLLWLSIRRGLHPLDELRHEIAKRQADNLTLLAEVDVPAEVRPMVSALNALLRRMADTLEQERRFTDDAAHQLRTPLAAIQAQLYTTRHVDDPAQRTLAMDQLQTGVGRAIRLVNQMLALARLDPEQTRPEFQPVALGHIAETVCAELAPKALQRDQTLELSVPPDLPPLMGNADMLSMLLSNLVDNAIQYTEDHGHIAVSIQPLAQGVQLQVSDNGPGIAPEQHQRVFERFYRIARQDQPGTGLGLSICQRIAELHHGRIGLSGGLDGRGLTVSVEFPAQATSEPPLL